MQRRQFIKSCCLGAGGVGVSTALSGCPGFAKSDNKMPSEPLNSEGEMIVARSRFDGGRSEILLGHPQLRYPIALMKISASEYSACLMRCSHQACETSVSASEIVCPCHGSRFSRSGDLLKGPATEDLTRYPVRLEGDTLYISGL